MNFLLQSMIRKNVNMLLLAIYSLYWTLNIFVVNIIMKQLEFKVEISIIFLHFNFIKAIVLFSTFLDLNLEALTICFLSIILLLLQAL